MANLLTSRDCVDYMLKRASEKDIDQGSFFQENALLHLNISQMELSSGTSRLVPQVAAVFPWARASQDKSVTLLPKVSFAGSSRTQGSITIGLGTAYASSLTGYEFKFDDSSSVYRIVNHTAGNSIATVDSGVAEATGAQSGLAFKVDYTIGSSDILRPVGIFRGFNTNDSGDDTNQVDGISDFDFYREFPVASEGEPTHFTVIKDNNGTFTVRFNKYPVARSKLNLPYIPIPSDLTIVPDTTPTVPRHHRLTLCELGLYYLFSDKGDDRATLSFQSAQVGYQVMLKELGLSDLTFEPFRPNVDVKGA